MNSVIIKEFSKLVSLIQEQLNDAYLDKNQSDINKHNFRLRQTKSILTKLRKYDIQITLENVNDLLEIKGIGKGAVKRIHEILSTGTLVELEGLEKKDGSKKQVLKELQQVIGIGRSIAVDLLDKYKLKSVEDLISRNKKGEIPLNNKILLGLKYHNIYKMNIPRKEIEESYEFMNRVIKKMNRQLELDKNNKLKIQICGSFRRGKPLSNDIDVLITKKGTLSKNKKEDAKYLNKFVHKLKKLRSQNNNKPFLIDDMTDKKSTYKYMGFCKFKDNPPRRIDIIFIPYESYPCALLYFTGSKETSVIMRNKAKEQGWKLNENELYDKVNKKQIKVKSEEEIFQKLEMEYLNPIDR
ncbi:DNA polymerase beta palm [seawater metagenome]|uniref:DNA polymerase beta palm n=1 Tax=seawater metagenome TaxID=1561972 RepID=A0A5E8CM08_9ZZZZ